jgi:hypothetical protein
VVRYYQQVGLGTIDGRAEAFTSPVDAVPVQGILGCLQGA